MSDGTMTKQEMLRLMRLLSAMESWAFAQSKPIPDYMHDDLSSLVEMLEGYILRGEK